MLLKLQMLDTTHWQYQNTKQNKAQYSNLITSQLVEDRIVDYKQLRNCNYVRALRIPFALKSPQEKRYLPSTSEEILSDRVAVSKTWHPFATWGFLEWIAHCNHPDDFEDGPLLTLLRFELNLPLMGHQCLVFWFFFFFWDGLIQIKGFICQQKLFSPWSVKWEHWVEISSIWKDSLLDKYASSGSLSSCLSSNLSSAIQQPSGVWVTHL